MKALMIIAALAGFVATTSAFAQTSAPTDGYRLMGKPCMKRRVPRPTTKWFRLNRTVSLRIRTPRCTHTEHDRGAFQALE